MLSFPMSRRGRACALVLLSIVVALSAGAGCPSVAPPIDAIPIALLPVADGLTAPVALAAPPDGSGRLFIAEQVGRVRIVSASGVLLPAPFLDLSGLMIAISPQYDERGLLGLAFHPGFSTNRRLFVFYSAPRGNDIPPEFDSEVRVSEFKARSDNPDAADAASEKIILRVGKPASNHNGGQIAFGPDGLLYVAIGDGGNANDVGVGHTPGLGNAQDREKLLGKILRIDVDGGDPYAIPADNPFVGVANTRGEIWAFGLRNAWRFSFDRGGERRLFAGDVGQNRLEEVNIITRGGNYGWNIREGERCFNPAAPDFPPANCPAVGAGAEPLVEPILAYPHDNPGDGRPFGVSVIGGFVYRGSAVPALAGKYVFGDWSRGFFGGDGSLFAATEANDGSWSFAELAIEGGPGRRIGRFVLGLGEDAAGELYVLSSSSVGPSGSSGRVDRIVAAPLGF